MTHCKQTRSATVNLLTIFSNPNTQKKTFSFIIALFLICFTSPHTAHASKTHIARKSETLHSIAHKYNVSVAELKSVNNMTGTHVSRGDRLIIPSHTDATAKRSALSEKTKTYKVSKGDTLPRIAHRTGIKMSVLRQLNNLKGNRVKPGQVLALNATVPVANESPRNTSAPDRLRLVNKELLNEQEFSDTLAELSDIKSDRPVDLAKNLKDNIGSIAKLKQTAYSFLGARYVFGGNRRNALDCSSFTQQVFREQKVQLPRTAREQFAAGTEVMRGDLQKGDLVFFQTYANFPSHVGIYLGNRKMIHASSRDHRVTISSMDTPYYLSRFLGARRIDTTAPEAINFSELTQGVEEEQEKDAQINDVLGLSMAETDQSAGIK